MKSRLGLSLAFVALWLTVGVNTFNLLGGSWGGMIYLAVVSGVISVLAEWMIRKNR